MRLDDFKLEKWLNPIDEIAKYNLGASCVKAFHVKEFFDFIGEDFDQFVHEQFKDMSLHYGYFFGMPRLKTALSKLYRDVTEENILIVHGGTGANNMVLNELVEPGDNVIAFLPNYQQHYSIPKSLGVEVRYLMLKEEDQYLPDLDELRKLVNQNTKLITLSNPNNPTGAFIGEDMQIGIAEIARGVGAYILSDEIYRGLDDTYMASFADVYERGIVTSSMSKVFSLAGTRVGWIIAKEKELYDRLENRRSYDTICCGPFDEEIAVRAIENHEKVLKRSREIVGESRAIFNEWMKTQPHLSCANESFSTTSFIKYDYNIPTEKLCADLLEKTGVSLCHGACFEIPKTFRLGYGFGQPEHFKEGLKILGGYLKTLE